MTEWSPYIKIILKDHHAHKLLNTLNPISAGLGFYDRTLWLLVGAPLVLGPEVASRRGGS